MGLSSYIELNELLDRTDQAVTSTVIKTFKWKSHSKNIKRRLREQYLYSFDPHTWILDVECNETKSK